MTVHETSAPQSATERQSTTGEHEQQDSAQNVAVAREFFARFSAGDLPGALDLIADDGTWWLGGKPDLLPFAGEYTKERIAGLFRRMLNQMPNGFTMTVRGAIAQDDAVVIEMYSHGVLQNGRHYDNEYLMLMRFADGKIRSVREYNDTQHAAVVWLAP